MTEALRRYTNVRREEVWPVLASAFFFCILTALMVLRPAQPAPGGRRLPRAAWRPGAGGGIHVVLNLHPDR